MGTDTTQHDDHHVEHKSHKKEYIIIFFVLGVLTILEIWAAELKMAKFTKGTVLTAFAVVKAGIVGYYYMHLKEETKWLKFIALIPIMAAVYALVLCLEAVFKPI
jgi:caa(3)-type oxidase subunit IV